MKEPMKCLSLLLVLAMAGCGGDGGAPAVDEADQPAPAAEEASPVEAMNLPEGVTAAMVAEGETIFAGAGLCFTCHMQGGVGGPLAPNLTDDVWTNIDGSYESIVQNVINGVAEPVEFVSPMLPRGGSTISDEEVRAVAAYVWTLSNGS
jgi:mono/diheme cytochrome c family protein